MTDETFCPYTCGSTSIVEELCNNPITKDYFLKFCCNETFYTNCLQYKLLKDGIAHTPKEWMFECSFKLHVKKRRED